MSPTSRPVLLLSDLHLPNTPSPLRAQFRAFLEGPARDAAAVYLLGDLFEYWIGDAEGLAAYAPEAAALRRLRDHGVPLYVQHGNRDFLLGAAFAHAAGLRLLPDPVVVDLAGTPTLLSHGDIWCTDDLGYQRWRRFSRNRLAQAIYRQLPRRWRQAVAGQARGGSAGKPMAILDVSDAAIEQAFVTHGVRRIIHGHTHRPAVHALTVDGRRVERLVLSDWHDRHCEYLEVDAAGMRRRRLP